jgi:two-component system, oxyanion-binding sensor
MALEKPDLRIGYTPLNDCAPLIVAQELGLFAEHGLNVRLERQNSWATSRDMLAIGALDAAHMLAPAVVAAWMGDGARNVVAPMALNLNGNTIVLSLPLYAELKAEDDGAQETPARAARALGAVVKARAARGERPLFLAAVFTESNHYLDLRRWLRAGGVAPETDVRIGVVPPGEVEQFLSRGIIDGYCVGEPWGSLAVARGVGRIVATSYDMWSNRIEKVLGVGAHFAESHPDTLDALLQAVLRAAQWADEPANRAAVASLLVHGGYVDAPIEVVRRGLTGRVPFGDGAAREDNPDFVVFHRYCAYFPWVSQAAWFGRALSEAGACPAHGEPRRAFRPSLLARAAEALGMALPRDDSKPEAAHPRPWTFENASVPIQMGREIAFDGANFEHQP